MTIVVYKGIGPPTVKISHTATEPGTQMLGAHGEIFAEQNGLRVILLTKMLIVRGDGFVRLLPHQPKI